MSSIPTSIGRYEVLGSIGRGGMGSLFLALDPKLDRQIAIKLLRDDDDELRERFAREARAAARLRHPNIVTIFDVGEHDGQPFIAMEYIQGQTLAEVVRGNVPLPLVRKLELMEALCDGLGFAHKSGIIHRDVKPANLMLDADGSLKILDFGIARAAESSSMTQAGMLIGTLNYMSPEQVSGQPVDLRSDLFAVGAVFYELVSYKQAFPGGLMAGILNKILSGQPEPLPSIVPEIDPQVVRIIERALDKDPAQRYQDLTAMRHDVATARMRLMAESPSHVLGTDPGMGDTVQTPSPVRRTTDLESLARRRLEQIRLHLADAESKLAAGDAEGAVAVAEQALMLDPAHTRAHAMVDRARAVIDARQVDESLASAVRAIEGGDFQAADELISRAASIDPETSRIVEVRRSLEEAVRRQEEARHREALDARARETVADAERQFSAGRRDEGVALLASFHPPHPLVAQSLERLRAQAAREADAERERLEAVERDARITSGIAEARGEVAAGRFADAVARLHALETSEGGTTALAAAIADAERHQREAERLARIAADVAKEVDEATVLLSKGSLQPALARAKSALALDRNDVSARAMVEQVQEAIRAEEQQRRVERERQEAEAAAARQREKASNAALKDARRAKSPDAAIPILRAALERDPDNKEVRRALEASEAEQARLRARDEEARRKAEEAARHKAAAATLASIPTADVDDRTVLLRRDEHLPAPAAETLPPSESRTPAPPPVQAKAPEPPSPTAAPAPAPAPRAKPSPPVGSGGPTTSAEGNTRNMAIAGAAAVVVLAIIGYFVFGGSPAPDAPVEPADQVAIPPAGEEQAGGEVQAEQPAIDAPVSESAAAAGAETPPPPAPTGATPAGRAAAAAPPAATPPPAPQGPSAADRRVTDLLEESQRRYAGGNRTAALEALAVGLGVRRDPRLLELASTMRRDAVSGVNAARGRATSAGASSLSTYRAADGLVQQAGAELEADDVVASVRTLWLAESRYGEAADEAVKIAAARAAAPPPAPEPAAAPVASAAADEAAIRAVLEQYRQAYNRLDVDAVMRVHPSADRASLARAFDSYQSQSVTFGDVSVSVEPGATTARATARVATTVRPRAGREQTLPAANVTFALQKRGSAWVITERGR